MYLFLGQQHVLLGQYLNGNIINDMYCWVINLSAYMHSCKKKKEQKNKGLGFLYC